MRNATKGFEKRPFDKFWEESSRIRLDRFKFWEKTLREMEINSQGVSFFKPNFLYPFYWEWNWWESRSKTKMSNTTFNQYIPKIKSQIFMKNFHGLIQEVWAKYKDEKLKISPITSPTIQPSSRCNESRQSQHLWSSMWKWRFSSFNFKACIVIRAPFNYLVHIVLSNQDF